MKKTIHINLAGQPYVIDEPAFDLLHTYIEALKKKFTIEAEQREILADIEARMAEVFAQRMGKTRQVVSEEDVQYVTTLLGKPEDIAGETEHSAATSSSTTTTAPSSSTYTGPVEKKLFRDTDNKFVGGVISGLCHYFGWGDPTWIRIGIVGIAVLSIFAHLGVGFPIAVVYFILLIVIPKALTSAEKLQMRGEPVTIATIEKEVREAMTTAAHSANTLIKDDNIGGKLLTILMLVLKAIGKLFMVLVFVVCFFLMLGLVSSFFGLSVLSSTSLTEVWQLLVNSRYTIMAFNVGMLLVIGIPLAGLMYSAIRYLAGSQVRNPILRRVAVACWFVGVLLLGFSSWSVFRHFAASDTTTQKVQLLTPTGGTLRVQIADTLGHAIDVQTNDEHNFSSVFHIDGLAKTDYGYSFSDVKLEVAVSPDTNYYVERVSYSKGTTIADAGKNIQRMRYKFSQVDTTLNLDNKFELPKEGKWRAQKIKLRLYVPEGKQVLFADNIETIDASVRGTDYYDDGMLSGRTLKIVAGKVKCLDCKEKMLVDQEDTIVEEDSDSSKNNTHITVKTGKDNEHLKDVSVQVNQNGISVTGKNDKDERVKVKVNSNGVSVIRSDTAGNTKISKEK